MDQIKAVQAEKQLWDNLVSPGGFLLKLYSENRFDDAQYSAIVEALEWLVLAYRDEVSVPKSLAGLLVELSLPNDSRFHDEHTARKVEDAADQFYRLTTELTGGTGVEKTGCTTMDDS